MSDNLYDHFERHYTLIIDNNELSWDRANFIARTAVSQSGVSYGRYEAMSEKERAVEWAPTIGNDILGELSDWVDEMLPTSGIPADLVREVMIFSDSELAWRLGKHYMPDPDGMVGVLDEGEE